MSAVDDVPGGGSAATGATLAELAEKLSRLREHLEQVLADLNASRGENAARLGSSTSAHSRLRCHQCGRTGSKEAAGWTLRLCGDDELHAFCPRCDHRYFGGNGG